MARRRSQHSNQAAAGRMSCRRRIPSAGGNGRLRIPAANRNSSRVRRQNRAERLRFPVRRRVVRRPGRPAAPMSPACFARVTGKNAVLDRIVRHGDPLAIHEHLDPGRGHAVWRGSAVPVVAAAPAVPVRQPRVDIVGLRWRRPAHQESQGRQDASRGHAHAAVLGCVRTLMPNRGAKRRERTGGISGRSRPARFVARDGRPNASAAQCSGTTDPGPRDRSGSACAAAGRMSRAPMSSYDRASVPPRGPAHQANSPPAGSSLSWSPARAWISSGSIDRMLSGSIAAGRPFRFPLKASRRCSAWPSRE